MGCGRQSCLARAAIADLRRVPSLLLGQIRRVFSLVAPRAARNCAISLGPATRSVLSRLVCDNWPPYGARRKAVSTVARALDEYVVGLEPVVIKLFRDIDPEGFRASKHNPLRVVKA